MADPFGALPELHRVRQIWAAKYAELGERRAAESRAFREEYRDELLRHGIDERQAAREVLAMIREATPTSREYDGGLERRFGTQ
jgi:hypothetical protein